MRTAYALLGLGFFALFGAAWFFLDEKAEVTDNETIIHNPVRSMSFSLTSPAFVHEGTIPKTYTCDGDNISPPLEIQDVPDGTQTLLLVMEDPDVPRHVRPDGMWDHWLVFNMPATLEVIAEGEEPEGVRGVGTGGSLEYSGPCPPPGETHRYFFRLYALDDALMLEESAQKSDLEAAMTGHIIEEATLMGRYARGQ